MSQTDRPRAVVLGIGDRPQVVAQAESLRPAIERQVELLAWDLGFRQTWTATRTDMVIVLGGDGSILRSALHMADQQVPVLGVNLGKLGFLAGLSPDQLDGALQKIRAGQGQIIEHLMFECEVFRDEAVIARRLGLNEAAVLAGASFRMLEVQLYVDAESVTTYSCDGLIISTPIGSTAHSLSAGGPILRKDLQAFVILPISPHTLTNRPVVDSAERVYELVVAHPHPGTSLVVDGRAVCPLERGDRVRIARSAARFKLIEVAGQTYYRTLREKLGWGGSFSPAGGSS